MIKSSCLLAAGGLTVAILLSGCGGESGEKGGNGLSTPSPTARITAQNASTVTGSSLNASYWSVDNSQNTYSLVPYSIKNSTDNENGANTKQANPLSLLAFLWNRQHNLTVRDLNTRNETEGQEDCTNGGYYDYKANEYGDNNNKEYRGNVQFHNCHESGLLLNGKVNYVMHRYNGTITTDDLTIISDDNETHITYDYFKGYGEIGGGRFTKIDILVSAKVTLKTEENGMPAGQYTYGNFHFLGEDLNSSPIYYSINGGISTPCTDGMVNLKTTHKVTSPSLDSCPTEGELEIIGANGKIIVVFKEDRSADLTFDGNTTHYNSCTDIPNNCHAS